VGIVYLPGMHIPEPNGNFAQTNAVPVDHCEANVFCECVLVGVLYMFSVLSLFLLPIVIRESKETFDFADLTLVISDFPDNPDKPDDLYDDTDAMEHKRLIYLRPCPKNCHRCLQYCFNDLPALCWLVFNLMILRQYH